MSYEQQPDGEGQHYHYAAHHAQYQFADPAYAEHSHENAGIPYDNNIQYTGEHAPFGGAIEGFHDVNATNQRVLVDQRPPPPDTKVRTVYKKAPGAPKRFKSSYVHFFTNFVEKKKQQLGPDGLPIKLDIGAVSKECSSAWKNLPDQEKRYWEYVMEKEKEEYFKQKDNYQGPWRIATDKVKKKEPGAPKRSPSAFFLFVNQRRMDFKAKYPEMPHTELVKTLGKIWAALPEEEKTPFREEELELRAQYRIDAEQWKKEVKKRKKEEKERKAAPKKSAPKRSAAAAAPAAAGYEQLPENNGTENYGVAPAMEKERIPKRKKKDPDAPKRSPPAFFLFVNHRRPQLKMQFPEMPHTELIKLCSQKWEGMSEEEKKPFRDHEEVLRHQYHIDVQNYKRKAVTQKEFSNIANSQQLQQQRQQLAQQQLQQHQQQLQLQQQQQQHQQQQQQQQHHHHHHQNLNQNIAQGLGVYEQLKYPYYEE